MALILSLRNNAKFYVDNREFTCSDIGPELEGVNGFYCEFKVSSNGRSYSVKAGERAEVGGGITIRTALRKRMKGRLASVAVDAPGMKVSRKCGCETCAGSGYISQPKFCPQCLGWGCSQCGNKGKTVERFVCPDCS